MKQNRILKYAINDFTFAITLWIHMIMSLKNQQPILAEISIIILSMGILPYAIDRMCWIDVFKRSITSKINFFREYRSGTRIIAYVLILYWILCYPLLLFFAEKPLTS